MKKEPSKEEGTKKTRITVDLDSSAYERLDKLESRVGASSKADVIRQALQLYEELALRVLNGEKVFVRDPKTKADTELLLVGVGLRKAV